MAELPPEILEHIFTGVTGDRCQNYRYFSLVCSSWRGPAQRELFGIATFTVTRLDLLVSSLDHFSYTSLLDNIYLCSLIASVPQLRISLFNSSALDPKFPAFLRLFTRIKKLFLSHNTKLYLFDEHHPHTLKSALLQLIHLPTLTSMVAHAQSLPIWFIPACVHLEDLQWISLPLQHRSVNPHLIGRDSSTCHLTNLYLEGSGANIISFMSWARRNSQSMPMFKVKNVTLCFRSNPHIWNYPFSLFCNATNVTLKFNQSIGSEFEYDPNQLKSLVSLKLVTPLKTAESNDPYKAMYRIFSWLGPFTTSPLLNLQTIQIEILYDTRDKWDQAPLLLQAADRVIERSVVMTRINSHFPQLKEFEVYAPWLRSHHANRIFAVPRSVLPDAVLSCGPRPPGDFEATSSRPKDFAGYGARPFKSYTI
ncbi:hypothetical protein NP233_g3518 [Leucocoprinus birnbaumii]|uniref:F-box domain-containing protein n=1 Tax=Leucocoprinus birnbaumii TaxID=56174 RepID=A0AAD5W054_9AGAR|nr:hypothetical protein NP233_g3518 [Leucocoprinus birnbaumii]